MANTLLPRQIAAATLVCCGDSLAAANNLFIILCWDRDILVIMGGNAIPMLIFYSIFQNYLETWYKYM